MSVKDMDWWKVGGCLFHLSNLKPWERFQSPEAQSQRNLIMGFLSLFGNLFWVHEKGAAEQRWRSLALPFCIQKHSSLDGSSAVPVILSHFFILFFTVSPLLWCNVGCKSISKSSFSCSHESMIPNIGFLSLSLHQSPLSTIILFISLFEHNISIEGNCKWVIVSFISLFEYSISIEENCKWIGH